MFHSDLNLETALPYQTRVFSYNISETPHHKHRTLPSLKCCFFTPFVQPSTLQSHFSTGQPWLLRDSPCTLQELASCSLQFNLVSVCVCVCVPQSKLCRLRQLQCFYLHGDLVVSDIGLVVSSEPLRRKHQHASVFPLLFTLHICNPELPFAQLFFFFCFFAILTTRSLSSLLPACKLVICPV